MSWEHFEVGTIVVCKVQMRKRRHRKFKWLAKVTQQFVRSGIRNQVVWIQGPSNYYCYDSITNNPYEIIIMLFLLPFSLIITILNLIWFVLTKEVEKEDLFKKLANFFFVHAYRILFLDSNHKMEIRACILSSVLGLGIQQWLKHVKIPYHISGHILMREKYTSLLNL